MDNKNTYIKRSRISKAKFRELVKVFALDVDAQKIALLTMHILETYKIKMGKTIKGVTKQSMKRLREYSWPGNVRELQHVVERAVILTEGEYLRIPRLIEETGSLQEADSEFLTFQEMERRHILQALEIRKWRVSGENGAARLLNLKSTTLFSKMRRLGIQTKTVRDL